MAVNLKPLDSFVSNTSSQFIIDDKFIDDLEYNFSVISSALNSHEGHIFVDLVGSTGNIAIGDIIEQVFYIDDAVIQDDPEPTSIYKLKTGVVSSLTINKVVDSDIFVRMTISEREFLSALIDAANLESIENFGISSLRIQIEQNAPLNELIRFTSGRTIGISQILGDDNITEIRFESTVPLKYFHINSYSVIPIKPDPSNPYRYKVRSGPYVPGSLRVYINTHRLPDDIIDQTNSSIGEFRFKSTVSRSELPGVSDPNDIIFCDFDIPIFESPDSSEDESVGWWAYINVEDTVLKANNSAAVLTFQPGNNILSITGINVADDAGFSDIITFTVDETEIDHNNLKNYVAAEHHLPGSDNQNVWVAINAVTFYDDVTPTAEGSISPSSTASTLTINSYNGIKVENAGSTIEFSIPDDIRINRTIYQMDNLNGNYAAIKLFNPSGLVVGDWVGIRAGTAISGQGTLVKLDATDFDDIRNPLGVVVDIDGSDVIVAYEGIIDATLAGATFGSNGDEMFIDESTPGNITSTVPSTSGNYQLRVGTVIDNNGSSFLMVRFILPVILIP